MTDEVALRAALVAVPAFALAWSWTRLRRRAAAGSRVDERRREMSIVGSAADEPLARDTAGVAAAEADEGGRDRGR